MYYVTDENENRVDLETALDTIVVSAESVSAVGLNLTIDGIECYGLSGSVNKSTYITGRVEYLGSGNAIFVDKNHDLSYYVNGSDYVNSSDYDTSPGTFGYEWGGYDVITNIKATAVGSGLSNTNSLIEMNLQPDTSGWYVIWDKIKEFRQSHSDKWFLPSQDELNLIYEARSNLSNLSTLTQPYYWSSSEYSSNGVREQNFSNGVHGTLWKIRHYGRSRLCRQY